MRWLSPSPSGPPGLWGLGSESILALGAELGGVRDEDGDVVGGFEVLKDIDGENISTHGGGPVALTER